MPEVTSGWSGSAFAVAPGLLVTNAHVALRCRAHGLPLRVEGRSGPWQVAMLDADADLALLQGPDAGEAVLPLSAAQRLPRGTPVLALGYPTSGTERRLAGQLHGTRGPILRATLTVHDPEGGRAVSFVMTDRQGHEIEPAWEDGLRYFGPAQAARLRWRLEIDAPSHGGSSGGPVLDAAGQVVGVVYAGGRGLTAAIPLEDLRDLLMRAGVTPVTRAPRSNASRIGQRCGTQPPGVSIASPADQAATAGARGRASTGSGARRASCGGAGMAASSVASPASASRNIRSRSAASSDRLSRPAPLIQAAGSEGSACPSAQGWLAGRSQSRSS
ncbi:serine protease [Pseudoroseomonas wenyumeiae]